MDSFSLSLSANRLQTDPAHSFGRCAIELVCKCLQEDDIVFAFLSKMSFQSSSSKVHFLHVWIHLLLFTYTLYSIWINCCKNIYQLKLNRLTYSEYHLLTSFWPNNPSRAGAAAAAGAAGVGRFGTWPDCLPKSGPFRLFGLDLGVKKSFKKSTPDFLFKKRSISEAKVDLEIHRRRGHGRGGRRWKAGHCRSCLGISIVSIPKIGKGTRSSEKTCDSENFIHRPKNED